MNIPDSSGNYSDSKHISCRVTNSIITHLESLGLDTSSIAEGFPFSREYLTDPLNWIPFSVGNELNERAAELSGDERIMYEVGLNTPKYNALGGVDYLSKLLGNPGIVYRSAPKYSKLFDRVTELDCKKVGRCKVEISRSVKEGYSNSKHACYYTQGILATIPTVWNLPPANVIELKCCCETSSKDNTEEKNEEANACIYSVSWEPRLLKKSRFGFGLFKRSNNTAILTKKLGTTFQLLDEKNEQLTQRNEQLSRIREIALGMDNLKTRGEILKLFVDQAVKLPGIRLVLVNALNEEKQLITTPYYSKLEDSFLYDALRRIRFDPDKILGENPDDAKLKFDATKFNYRMQEYFKNPATLVVDKLSELLDGVWPGFLCNNLQKLLSVKRIFIIPIAIESTGSESIIYLLDGDIPVDMLEMLTAHCSAAMKNVKMIDALQLSNRELSSINSIISKTSQSLKLNYIIDSAVTELISIFDADMSCVYMLNDGGNTLELVAHHGFPADYAVNMVGIRIDGNDEVKNLLLQDEIVTGDLYEYSGIFPQHSVFKNRKNGIPFITAALYSGNNRYGISGVFRIGGPAFSEQEKAILKSISNQLSISINNAELHRAVTNSENRLNLIVKSVSDGIILTDLEGNIQQVNDAALKMHGFQGKEEFINKSVFELIPEKNYDMIKRNTEKILSGSGMGALEYCFLKKDGSEFSAELNANQIVDSYNSPIGFVASIRDITERKKAEDLLLKQKQLIDRILESTPDSVAVVDKNVDIVLVNSAFCRYFKTDSRELTGKPLKEILQVEDIYKAISEIFEQKEYQVNQVNIEFRYRLGNEDKIFLADIIKMAEDQILIMLNDVTDERERQDMLYLTDRLVSLGEMASGIAHELNNPLTAILGLSDLLDSDENLPESVKEDIRAIHSESKRAASIIKSMISFARKHIHVRERTDINEIVEEVIRFRTHELRLNNIQILTELDRKLPEIMADYQQIQQVFLNILLNAEFAVTEAGKSGKISISTKRTGEYVEVVFKDSGPGIPEEYLDRIFDPFFTTKDVGKGTGLGLSICYGIMKSHGGLISAGNIKGEGACFTLKLPVNYSPEKPGIVV